MANSSYKSNDGNYTARDNTRVGSVPGYGLIQSESKGPIQHKIDVTEGPMGYIPFLGDGLQAWQAKIDYDNGDVLSAGIGAGTLLMPPALSKFLRKTKPTWGPWVRKGLNYGMDRASSLSPRVRAFLDKYVSGLEGELSKVDVERVRKTVLDYQQRRDLEKAPLLPRIENDLPNYIEAKNIKVVPATNRENIINRLGLTETNSGLMRAGALNNGKRIVVFPGNANSEILGHEFRHSIQDEFDGSTLPVPVGNTNIAGFSIPKYDFLPLARLPLDTNPELDGVRSLLKQYNPNSSWHQKITELDAEVERARQKFHPNTTWKELYDRGDERLDKSLGFIRDRFHLRDNDEANYLMKTLYDNGYANGGRFIHAPKYNNGTARFMELLDDYASMLYNPYEPSVPEVSVPVRYEPQPHYGLYEYPASTGMAEVYPVTTPGMIAAPVVVSEPEEAVEDLFSEEAMARRALKQRYAESNFDNKAKSHAGAMGAWQIMPITYKDYLGRGRGKAGDLNDPEYNRKVRDWVMGIIPRDLQDLYSENDAPRVKLAKIYGAYNWGAGNMRKYLRKQREAGVDISNDTSWVEGLNPETKRYIKYLALDEDIPDSTYTNKAFEEAAAKRGHMKNGGPIKRFDDGGDKFQLGDLSGGLYPLTPTEHGEDIVLPYTAEGLKEKRFYDDPSNKKTHRVSAGETAWGISQQAGVPLSTLLKMNPDIGDGSLIKPGQELMLGYKPYPANREKDENKAPASMLTYKVQKGDYLGKIAKDNGLTLEQLLKINPQFAGRENAIAIGETINLGEAKQKREFKTMRERREWERGLDDVSAIQNYKHEKNYAIVDKERQTMTVYSPDNKIVRVVHVNTGSSNDDFNTRTYSDDKGHILYGQGNMSTPAGITEIVSIGKDYGHKSYVRARVGSDGKVRTVKDENGNTIADTIASSMHYEKGLFGPNSSNGCIRMSGADADSLSDVLGVGSRVYTLPQRKDENGDSLSRFKLEDGKLSFYSDDPVGRIDNNGLEPIPVYEKGRPKKDKNGNIIYRDFASEDDYNLTRDMTAAPLFSNYSGDGEAGTELERNRAAFANTLADEKQSIMSDLIANKIGLNSDTYNRLAELSVALAAQESEFGTGNKFRIKAAFPGAVRALKGENGAQSVGVTQMKYAGYNDEVRKIMRRMRINTSIDTDNQKDIENSARATMVLLAYMYNNQLTPSHRRKLKEAGMSEEEALAMMFNGRSVKELEELVSDKNWREKLITVSKYPDGIGRNLPFDLGTKEVLAADYANKVNKYLQENEPFHYSFGGLLDKLGSVYGNDRTRMLDAIRKIRQK